MDEPVLKASEALREFMFEKVYFSDNARGEEEKAERMLTATYEYFINNCHSLPQSFINLIDEYGKERVVCDYLSSMTDRYAVYTFNRIFVPKGWTLLDENG